LPHMRTVGIAWVRSPLLWPRAIDSLIYFNQ
jgi:hypothetical protein